MTYWMKRFWTALIAVLTVGLYIPQLDADADTDVKEAPVNPYDESLYTGEEDAFAEVSDTSHLNEDETDFSALVADEDILQLFTERAKEETLTKLGPKISGKVEDHIAEEIFPTMEEAIHTIFDDWPSDDLTVLELREQKSSYTGEKIFHIVDGDKNEDIARFHVRRDLKPKEGYWFNFHYHTHDDNFSGHHEIGEIYWDKNTPPKWMS
ncbi:YpjP family protein [Salisediminibacterium halotolerans]|uniref:YpjP family protein n=1 Tax=Salisediminibacterium halotolerans TaxID=517425 RepID=UPI000EAD9418|nr:YpjP family protein [Salisediminibacterium halotolerans]RLJ71741.1 YpjP-like protein [Actinophytocola xinjiangensis]RPE86891.1 YpjP-like protein [Salisediminibacterium halotolerans]TWG32954.1 YpjP-like protein [Salisediminibacterium halotolerans]GEL09206.1 cell division protein FtsK [Salisediminibacterium halotolerans]